MKWALWLAILAIPQITIAGSITYQGQGVIPPGPSSGYATGFPASLPKWNPSDHPGEALDAITIALHGNISISGGFQNFAGAPPTVLFSGTSSGGLTLPNSFNLNASASTLIVAPAGWTTVTTTPLATHTFTSHADLTAFMGNGNFSMPWGFQGHLYVSPYLPHSEGLQDQVSGGFDVSVTYLTVAPAVPEPSSMILAMLAIIGFLVIRK